MNTDLPGFCEDFLSFSQQNMTLTEAELTIDRKLLYSWKKNGLLPYSGAPKQKGENKSWGRFSFIELCWLKVLIEFRKVGLGIDKIKEIKSVFFDPEFLDSSYEQPLPPSTISLPPDLLKIAEEKGIIKNDILQLQPEIRKIFENLQFSLFSCIIYTTILHRRNFIFYVSGNNKIKIEDLNIYLADPVASTIDVFKLLNQESIVIVNLKKIIADLSKTHEIFTNNLHLNKILSDSSIHTLKELFKENGVREVTIRANEKGIPIVMIKKHMKLEDLQNEVRRIQKKGNYCDLLIKTRDGQVQYFECTEIIKL